MLEFKLDSQIDHGLAPLGQNDLLARSRAAVWHPCTQMKRLERLPLVPIERGEGAWLIGPDGERYLDAVSSWWVNLFGHGEPRIKNAIKQQLDKLEHVMLAGFTHRPVVELSERLGELTGLGHAFYGSDGASATEIALKMSAHYWKKPGSRKQEPLCLSGWFVSRRNHRRAFGHRRAGFPRRIRGPGPWQLYCAVARLAPGAQQCRCARYGRRSSVGLAALLAAHHSDIAAVILEPLVQGAAGMAMYHPHYLERARALCDRYQVHLIADEIAVGFGRTGSLFACEQAKIKPDLLCLSKGITGGFFCRWPPCSQPTKSTAPSTMKKSAAAFCIRIRTPATRWRAPQHWRCWIFSAMTR